MNKKKFVIRFFIQGKFYKKSIGTKDFNWKWLDLTEQKIREKYKDFRELKSTGDGCYVLFNEKTKEAVCYNYDLTEVTDLYDARHSQIIVGDWLIKKQYCNGQPFDEVKDFIYAIHNSGWDDSYYLRSVYHNEPRHIYNSDGHFSRTEPAVQDIRNVTQDILNDFIWIPKYETN